MKKAKQPKPKTDEEKLREQFPDGKIPLEVMMQLAVKTKPKKQSVVIGKTTHGKEVRIIPGCPRNKIIDKMKKKLRQEREIL